MEAKTAPRKGFGFAVVAPIPGAGFGRDLVRSYHRTKAEAEIAADKWRDHNHTSPHVATLAGYECHPNSEGRGVFFRPIVKF
jgi:hypothetical protein